MEQSLYIATVLLFSIVSFEGWRRWTGQPFGMLTIANGVFALNFCVSPILLTVLPGSEFENGPFGAQLFMLTIMKLLNLDGAAYLWASLVTVFAYALMVGTYMAVARFKRPQPLNGDTIPAAWLTLVGLALSVVAVAALLVYSAQFKDLLYGGAMYRTTALPEGDFGLIKMLKVGMLVRGGKLDITRGYLQIIVMLGVPAVMLLSASALRHHGIKRWLIFSVVTIVWLTVLARVYHASGRMELTVFLAFVPLAVLLGVRSTKAVMIGGGVLLIFGLFMVLARHEFFPQPGQTASVMINALAFNSGRSVLFLFNEFAFPFPVAAHTLSLAEDAVGYRYFVDLPLAMLYMLPSIGGVDVWPEMISHIHNRIVPLQLPYDLVSFGYYSLGFAGVGLVFMAIGAAFAVMDAWLAQGKGWLSRVLLAAWMMFLPFRIMYADPYTSMKTGFGLIVGTVLVVVMAYLAKRWKRV